MFIFGFATKTNIFHCTINLKLENAVKLPQGTKTVIIINYVSTQLYGTFVTVARHSKQLMTQTHTDDTLKGQHCQHTG